MTKERFFRALFDRWGSLLQLEEIPEDELGRDELEKGEASYEEVATGVVEHYADDARTELALKVGVSVYAQDGQDHWMGEDHLKLVTERLLKILQDDMR